MGWLFGWGEHRELLRSTFSITDTAHRQSIPTSSHKSIIELGEDSDSHNADVDESSTYASIASSPADSFDMLKALLNLQTDVSPWTSPQPWLDSDRVELEYVIASADMDQEDRSIFVSYLHADTIFQVRLFQGCSIKHLIHYHPEAFRHLCFLAPKNMQRGPEVRFSIFYVWVTGVRVLMFCD